MEDTESPPSLLSEGRTLIPDKASPLCKGLEDDEPAVFFINYASVVQKNVYTGGVFGHYFNFGTSIMFNEGAPQLAKFKVAGDAIVLSLKLSSAGMPYLYGITVENLIKFSEQPPARPGDVVDDTKWLQSWKLPVADLESLHAGRARGLR